MTYLHSLTDEELVRHLVQINPTTDLERHLIARFEQLVDKCSVVEQIVAALDQYNLNTENPAKFVRELDKIMDDASEAEELRITVRELRDEVLDLETLADDLRDDIADLRTQEQGA